MPPLTWMGAEESLSSQALTVRAQTLPPDNTGELFWDVFYPRRNVNSTTIREILDQEEVRYSADRREFNARGRLIPLDTPAGEEIKIMPIESYFKIEEEEIQSLEEQTFGNEALFQRIVGVQVPQRVDKLVRADYRRLEIDVFRAWATGQITVRNPQLGHVAQTFTFPVDSARYMTAATAWDDPSVNAFDELLAWLDLVELLPGFGPVSGIVLRRADYNLIREAASAAISVNNFPMLRLTRAQFEQRVTQERGRAFNFFILESTMTEFADGGVAPTTVDIWPAGTIAAVPAVGSPGFSAFAPVARAFELARVAPEAKIDRNGVTVYVETAGNGRELTCEAQLNAAGIPIEAKTAVMDIGTA